MQIRSYGAKDHICAGSRLWLSSLEHFGFNTKLGTNSAPVCSISSWKEDEATLHESLPHNKTASKKTGQLPTQRVSCFLPGIKVAAVYLWGSLQGVGPTVGEEDGGDGGDGGGWHSDGHHHPDRGRQRYRAGAIQIVPTTLRWWPNFYNSNFFSFTYNAKLQISPKLFQEDGIEYRFEQALPSCTKTYR